MIDCGHLALVNSSIRAAVNKISQSVWSYKIPIDHSSWFLDACSYWDSFKMQRRSAALPAGIRHWTPTWLDN